MVFTAPLLSTQYSGVAVKTGWIRNRIMCPECGNKNVDIRFLPEECDSVNYHIQLKNCSLGIKQQSVILQTSNKNHKEIDHILI